jgi:two-component system response regulator HydG
MLPSTMTATPDPLSHLLVVDDDAEMRDSLGLFFSGMGHRCELAADAAGALDAIQHTNFDAVVCDVRMDGMSGLELLDRAKRADPDLPFVVITGHGAIQEAVSALKLGAFQYMTKPCDPDELREVVGHAIESRRRSERAGSGRPPPSTATEELALVGNGAAMRALQSRIDSVAASSAPVVITGETGAGKELVARAIHARGSRRRRAFVPVNTSAIPEELLEGEIFGHVRGAFTGAVQARKGLLTEADGGTLLLDEIGDMPIGLQSKLLRVLQFGDVRAVGSDRTHRVDVRVIASTHRDLESLIREGRFREDLYFRLNVLPVFVPPLRDRPEDIAALAEHFLQEARQRTPNSPVRSIDDEGLRVLMAARWPGNVRELAAAIERAVVFGADRRLNPQLLPGGLQIGTSPVARPPFSFESAPPRTLRQMNRAYTDWVLALTGGNKERAAAILGVDLSTVYRWDRDRRA